MKKWIQSLLAASAAAAVGFVLMTATGCSNADKKGAAPAAPKKADDHAGHDHGDGDHKHGDADHKHDETTADGEKKPASEPLNPKEIVPVDPAGKDVQTGEPPEIDLPKE